MPLTHIHLSTQYTHDERAQISRILQDVFITSFDVPKYDCFQLFHRYQKDDWVIDPNYLSAGRTERFILFEITAGKPRSYELQQNFMQQLAVHLAQNLAIAPSDVMVVIHYNRAQDWSFASGRLFKLEDIQ